jgi:hypothetical protein
MAGMTSADRHASMMRKGFRNPSQIRCPWGDIPRIHTDTGDSEDAVPDRPDSEGQVMSKRRNPFLPIPLQTVAEATGAHP